MQLSVHFTHTPTESAVEYLHSLLDPSIKLTHGDIPEAADYQILINGRPERKELEASPNLHTVIIPWAGLATETAEIMRDFSHLALHNLHYNAPPVAESAIGLMIAAAKTLIPADREFRRGDWKPRYQPYPSLLLQGKTVLILGYGAIGAKVADICRALGMDVLGIRRSANGANGIFPPEKLHELLPRANVLMVCLPGTDATNGLIGEHELALMPDGAIVVNIGRGPVIDAGALYQALKSGHLFGAGLDVWYTYPPDKESQSSTFPSEYPFHELDNVVMSPHRAAGGRNMDIELLRMEGLAAMLNLAAQGAPLPNRVDLEAGY